MSDYLDQEVPWKALTAVPAAGASLPLPVVGLSRGHAVELARLLFPVRGIDLGRYVVVAS
jgi:hypothetical protein